MEKRRGFETGIVCPLCGAPYRYIVSPDVAQVKCEYCGGIFSVPHSLEDTAPRCANHPEALAIGLCNDCGRNFCIQCLCTYNLTGHEEATLYLCPECFRERQLKQANSWILAGSVSLVFCLLFALMIPIGGILLFLIISVPIMIYGLFKRVTLPKVPSAYVEEENQLTSKAEIPESTPEVDTGTLYDKMLYEYVMRFGPAGREMLENEIYTWVRCAGLDYKEAVCKVAQSKGLIKAETTKT
jgi:hypothetical protein